MIKVSNLARILDKRDQPNFLAQCIEMKKCRPNITRIEQMTQRERQFYESREEEHAMSYNLPEVWGPIIA